MVATGQENVRGKKASRSGKNQGKVREFHSESVKVYVYETSRAKVKLNHKLMLGSQANQSFFYVM